jgi:hypothetical protein
MSALLCNYDSIVLTWSLHYSGSVAVTSFIPHCERCGQECCGGTTTVRHTTQRHSSSCFWFTPQRRRNTRALARTKFPFSLAEVCLKGGRCGSCKCFTVLAALLSIFKMVYSPSLRLIQNFWYFK